jgi:hypothetical protein
MSSNNSRISDIFSTVRIRKSINSLKSKAGSIRSSKSHKRASFSSYTPYVVYQQTMFPTILRDADVTQKLLDIIIDTPGGKRSVSRLARTCKAFCEPALNVLWRELDSLIPMIALFPAHLLRKVRRPGLGLVRCIQDKVYFDTNVLIGQSTSGRGLEQNPKIWDTSAKYHIHRTFK